MEILFHDEHFVAVNKPSGLLVHRSIIAGGETRFAMQMLRDKIGRHVFPVHRLDRPTSGVLIFALSPEAARRIAESFRTRLVSKKYLAVVRGVVEESGVIDCPLVEEPDPLERRRIQSPPVSQDAVTEYRRLASVELPFPVGRYPSSRYSLVGVFPHTGRRHQIRRHLKHIFHPVIGDTRYGEGRHNRLFRNEYGCGRMLLAAVETRFIHPWTSEAVTVTAPLDTSFADVIDRLGWAKAVSGNWLREQTPSKDMDCYTLRDVSSR
jgi:tRNA pseudouridine65 synthase